DGSAALPGRRTGCRGAPVGVVPVPQVRPAEQGGDGDGRRRTGGCAGRGRERRLDAPRGRRSAGEGRGDRGPGRTAGAGQAMAGSSGRRRAGRRVAENHRRGQGTPQAAPGGPGRRRNGPETGGGPAGGKRTEREGEPV